MTKGTSSVDHRMLWVDILRGLAICNVVVFHVHGRMLEEFGSYSEVFGIGVGAASPVRMPTFMFLSGLLLSGSMSRGTRQYLDAKIRRIAYPFLVWSIITIVALVLAQPLTGTQHSLWSLLDILHEPPAGLWFLQYLFIAYLLALLFRYVPRAALLAATLTVALIASLQEGLYPFAWFFYLFAFFIVGDWFGDRPATWIRLAHSRLVMLVTWTCVPVYFLLAAIGGAGRVWVLTFPLALGGLLVLTQFSQAIERTRLGNLLAYLGQNALEIYVVHMLFIPVVLAILRPSLGSQPVILASALVVMTMLLSLLPVWLRTRIPQVKWFFSLPLRVIPERSQQPASEQASGPPSYDDTPK